MVENVLQKLCEKFDAGHARYRVVHHPAGDRSSESVAKVRGTEVGQGAKALVCMAKGCILGAVPPVALHEKLLGVADPTLFTRYEELAFNAGARDVSIIINTEDFHRIVAPKEISFLKSSEPTEIE